jgi:hypothetical protein
MGVSLGKIGLARTFRAAKGSVWTYPTGEEMYSPLNRGRRLISGFHAERKSLRSPIPVSKPEKSENGLSP